MASGLLVMSALALALTPAGTSSEGEAPASLVTDPTAIRVSSDLPLPTRLDTTLAACPSCPAITLQAGEGATSERSGTEPASPWSKDPIAAVRDAPPEAVIAGSSLLATLTAAALWLARPALGLFSRIEDDELARHPMRRQALDFIAANPGATLQDVRRSLGVAWGTAVYHLGRLERAGLVAVRHIGGHRGHWPLGQAPAHGALAPTGQALADLVRSRPGLPQNELARLVGIGSSAACKQLRRLESAGLVVAQREGKARVYAPAAIALAAA